MSVTLKNSFEFLSGQKLANNFSPSICSARFSIFLLHSSYLCLYSTRAQSRQQREIIKEEKEITRQILWYFICCHYLHCGTFGKSLPWRLVLSNKLVFVSHELFREGIFLEMWKTYLNSKYGCLVGCGCFPTFKSKENWSQRKKENLKMGLNGGWIEMRQLLCIIISLR